MFNISHEDGDPHEVNAKSLARRKQALEANNLKTDPLEFPCAILPGTDALGVWREGAPELSTTNIAVGVSTYAHEGITAVYLSPMDTRRAALALLHLADEADGLKSGFHTGDLYLDVETPEEDE